MLSYAVQYRDPAAEWQLATTSAFQARYLRDDHLWPDARGGLRDGVGRWSGSLPRHRGCPRAPSSRRWQIRTTCICGLRWWLSGAATSAPRPRTSGRFATRLRHGSACRGACWKPSWTSRRGRVRPAIEDLQRATATDPTSPAAVAALVAALQAAGRWDEAAELASDLLSVREPRRPWLAFLTTWSDFGEGLPWLRQVAGDRMMRLPGRPGCLCLGAVLAAGLSLAVPRALAQFRIESQAVLVDVAVSDGGPVLDLRKEDFELYEAGEPTSFQLLDPALLPVAVVFAMDVSASTVGERQRRLGEGAALFAGGLTRRDSCAVIAFSMEPFWTRAFAPCGADVRTDVRAEAPGGPTSVRDSMVLSLAVLPSGGRQEGAPVVHGRVRQPELDLGRPGDDGGTGFRGARLFHRRASARFLPVPGAERRWISLDSGGL